MRRLAVAMIVMIGIIGGAELMLGMAVSDKSHRGQVLSLFITAAVADDDDDDLFDDDPDDRAAVGDDISLDDESADDLPEEVADNRDDDDELWADDFEPVLAAADDSVDAQGLALDHQGYIVRTAEILAINAEETALELIEALGFAVLRQQNLDALNIRLTVIETPVGTSVREAIERLRQHDPAALYEFNHLYAAMRVDETSNLTPGQPGFPVHSAINTEIGLIDTAVDVAHQALRNSRVISQRFVDDKRLPMVHGTSIASLLVGESNDFQGLLPGAQLYSAAVFTQYSEGQVSASADSLAAALNWLVKEEVAVINMSLAGPPNALLEMAVGKSLGLGHMIVAAVGNDGPAAPPLYPAAYPGVVAVTAVDAKQRIYRRANRGDYVDFSAAGVNVRAADQGNSMSLFSGTSYAVPVVSAILARRLLAADTVQQQALLAQLRQQAADIGVAGRDSVFGYGLLSELSDQQHGDE